MNYKPTTHPHLSWNQYDVTEIFRMDDFSPICKNCNNRFGAHFGRRVYKETFIETYDKGDKTMRISICYKGDKCPLDSKEGQKIDPMKYSLFVDSGIKRSQEEQRKMGLR